MPMILALQAPQQCSDFEISKSKTTNKQTNDKWRFLTFRYAGVVIGVNIKTEAGHSGSQHQHSGWKQTNPELQATLGDTVKPCLENKKPKPVI